LPEEYEKCLVGLTAITNCLKDDVLSGSQMYVTAVTGPRIDLAIALTYRMKKLFASSKGIAAAAAFDTSKSLVAFYTEERVIELNNVKIESFPSKEPNNNKALGLSPLAGNSSYEVTGTPIDAAMLEILDTILPVRLFFMDRKAKAASACT
jgi:hypothetical protein